MNRDSIQASNATCDTAQQCADAEAKGISSASANTVGRISSICRLCGSMPAHPYEACAAVLEVEYFEGGKLKRLVKRDAWFPTP